MWVVNNNIKFCFTIKKSFKFQETSRDIWYFRGIMHALQVGCHLPPKLKSLAMNNVKIMSSLTASWV